MLQLRHGVTEVELGRCGGIALSTEPGELFTRLVGELPAARIGELTQQLATVTHGQGVFTSELDHYRPVHSVPPVRARTGVDPRDRTAWFRENPR